MSESDKWARLAVVQMLARLLAQIRDRKVLADDPWLDTRPGVRRAGKPEPK